MRYICKFYQLRDPDCISIYYLFAGHLKFTMHVILVMDCALIDRKLTMTTYNVISRFFSIFSKKDPASFPSPPWFTVILVL